MGPLGLPIHSQVFEGVPPENVKKNPKIISLQGFDAD